MQSTPASKKGVWNLWFFNANVTVGSVPSETIGTYHQEQEREASATFHKLLPKWEMALPATFHHDPTSATTWTSRTSTTRIHDFVALPRTLLPMVEFASVDR